MTNLVKLLKQAGQPTEVEKTKEQAEPGLAAKNLKQTNQALSKRRLPGILNEPEQPIQPASNLEQDNQRKLISLLEATKELDEPSSNSELRSKSSSLRGPGRNADLALGQEGILTTPTGSKLISLLKAQPDSAFSAEDLDALAGFNLRPLPSNYEDLPDLEKKAVRMDRRASFIAEKGRISQTANDILEGLQLEEKGLEVKGKTLKTVQKQLKKDQKTPLTFMTAFESTMDRMGRAIRARIIEGVSLKEAWSIYRPEIAGGKKLAQTRKYDTKHLLEKRGFVGPPLSEVLPDIFVEDPETTANKHFLPLNLASIKSKFQLRPGSIADVTPQGVLGFIGDIGTNPMYWIMPATRSMSAFSILRVGKEVSKKFPELVDKIGKPIAYLNRKGADELFKIRQTVSSDLTKQGIKATERQVEDLATTKLLSKYGPTMEKAPHLLEPGGLKISVPGMPDASATLIKGQTIKNAVNTITENISKHMPEELKPAVDSLKYTWEQMGHKISEVGKKYFGGEGSQIKNELVKDMYLEMMSSGVSQGRHLNREILSKTLLLAKESGLSTEGAAETIAAFYTSNIKQIAARTQLIKKDIGAFISRNPGIAGKYGEKLAKASDLDETLKVVKQIKKSGTKEVSSKIDDLVKEAEIQVHMKTNPLLATEIPGLKAAETEGAKVYMQGLRNLAETNLQEFASLNAKYNHEGRLVDWFPAVQFQKALQGVTGIDARSTEAITQAINSLKRTKGANAQIGLEEIKKTLAIQNPKQNIKLVSDLHKGFLASEDAVRVATLKQVFQSQLNDLFAAVPKTEKVPLQLVKGTRPAMVPTEIAKQLTLELNKATTMQNAFVGLWKAAGAEATTQMWKTLVTQYFFPVFNSRNSATELMNGFMDRGLATFMGHGEAIKMQVPSLRKTMRIVAYDGTDLGLAEEVFQKLRAGYHVDNFKAEFVDDINDFLQFDSYRLAGLQRATTDNSLTRALFTGSQVIENHFRLTTFLHNFKKTKNFDMAVKAMNDWHVNYKTVLSPFERSFVKRVLPFYTFSKRNYMVQLRALVNRPGITAFPLEALRAAGDELSEDELNAMPSWLLGRVAITTGINKDGTSQITMVSGHPAEEAFGRFFVKDNDGNYSISGMVAKAIGGLLNPIIKFPVEHLMDRSLFFGGKIRGDGTEIVYDKVPPILSLITSKLDQVQPEASKALRALLDIEGPKFNAKIGKEEFTMNPVILHMLQNLPISRFISYASQISNEDLTALQRAIGATTNVSFKKLDIRSAKESRQKSQRGKLLDILNKDREKTKARAIAAGFQPPARPKLSDLFKHRSLRSK